MLKIALLSALLAEISCTTEWFGDLRAHLNPPQLPPFYDVVYDESDCPFGLESIAIPEFVYFGEMIATKAVREHSLCLQYCLETPRCKAVNYFESLGGKKDQGFCELLVETQYDNPRLMRPFRKATYYEKIRCRTSDEEEEQPFEFDSNGKEGKQLVLSSAGSAQSAEQHKQKVGKSSNSNDEHKEKGMALKKLEQKVQEFNLRFKSRR